MRFTPQFLEEIRERLPVSEVVGKRVRLKKAGREWKGLSPFQQEKTPSFTVNDQKGFYHDFSSGKHGNIFDFVMETEGVGFIEAVERLAAMAGLALPAATPEAERHEQRRKTLYDVMECAAKFFADTLASRNGAKARGYLGDRGLSPATQLQFRLGYAPPDRFALKEYLGAQGIPTEDMVEAGLLIGGDDIPLPYDRFRDRVMFPITDLRGRVIAFGGRALEKDVPAKYLNSPETAIYSKSRVLFNLDHAKEAIRKLDYAILVEGQMDCISVFAAGFQNVLASSGTAFTEMQARLLGRFSKNVVVNFDPDTAGAKATERTLGLLVEEDFQIKVLTLEAGFDPDLYIRRKGKDAYAEALKHQSQRYFDYLIGRAQGQFPTRTPEGKVKAVNYLLPHIQRVPSRIVRDELAHEIAQKLGIDSAVLRQELKHVAASRSAATIKAAPEAQVTDAERILIRALASASEIQTSEQHLSARDGAEEEFDPARQARFALQSERLYEGLATESLMETLIAGGLEVTDVMELPFSDSDRARLASILLKDAEELSAERVEGGIRALRRIHLRRRLDAVQRRLEAPGRKDPEEMQALLQEKVRLKHALRDPSLAEDNQATSQQHRA